MSEVSEVSGVSGVSREAQVIQVTVSCSIREPMVTRGICVPQDVQEPRALIYLTNRSEDVASLELR